MINISFLEVPMDSKKKLKDAMFYTAQPLYKNRDIEFTDLHKMVSSDYRQYSPFLFNDGIKKSENWDNSKQNILILDIDDGLTIDEAKKIFKDYMYLICTTKSHRKEKKGKIEDRYRVILKSFNIPIGDDYFLFTNELEKIYPFIDKQVNTKTGAFLGFTDCEYWYNDGKDFDCSPILQVAKDREKIKEENKKFVYIDRNYNNDLPLDEIRNLLTRETVADIVSSLGYDVNRKFMFKYRLDERSPSASISNNTNPLIKDFGSDLETDCIGFVQEVKSCDFKTAVEYVGSYLNVQAS